MFFTYTIFYRYNSLISIPDISKWYTFNVESINYLFYGCNSLVSLPDISKWIFVQDNNINNLFNECNSLISLSDLSQCNISFIQYQTLDEFFI